MLTLRKSTSVLLLVVVATSVGCRRTESAAPPAIINEDADLTLTVKVRGNVTADFDAKVMSKYTAIRSSGSSGSVDVLGVRPADALRQGQVAFVPGMSVTPYKGDGTYVVERSPEAGAQPPTAQGAKSSVTLYWYGTGKLEDDPLEFSRYVENCVIKINKEGTVGQAKCPKMTTPTGDKTISLEFKWKAPKFQAKDRVTLPPDSSTSSSTP